MPNSKAAAGRLSLNDRIRGRLQSKNPNQAPNELKVFSDRLGGKSRRRLVPSFRGSRSAQTAKLVAEEINAHQGAPEASRRYMSCCLASGLPLLVPNKKPCCCMFGALLGCLFDCLVPCLERCALVCALCVWSCASFVWSHMAVGQN